jgi:predicted ester cyclase
MKGFDAEFRDLDHYIRAITERIWEGRRVDDIHRYYSADCAVETPSSVSIGAGPVVDGTHATLRSFPDRRLLAEDVVQSGDDVGGFLSSHRIFSPMTHAGPGAFGAPTGRPVFARTIADCVCINNRIVHEWLVRDQAAIARHIGLHESELAQRWLNERGGFSKPAMPPAPAPYQSAIDSSSTAQSYAQLYEALWCGTAGAEATLLTTHMSDVISALPGGETRVGVAGAAGLANFWQSLRGAFPQAQFTVEHLAANPRPLGESGSKTAVAMRWRVQAQHTGGTRYGAPTGRAVEVLGICHAEFENGRVQREWVLIDDVALWMQVLTPRGTKAT